MANSVVLSFNSGELSPLADARSDVAKYSSGCRTLQNAIPRVYGCAVRRPGTEFIHRARSGATANPVLLVPFEYSATSSYVCEFGHTDGAASGYIRFYIDGGILLATADTSCVGTVSSSGRTVTFSSSADAVKAGYHATDPKLGGQITAGGQAARSITGWTSNVICTVDSAPSPAWSTTAITQVQLPVQVSTPFQQDDLFHLQFRQLNDVMWILYQNQPLTVLSRTSATTFVLSYLQEGFTPTHELVGGPFRERNDIAVADGVTLEPSGTTGNVTVRAFSDTELITAPMVTGGWTLGYDTGGWSIAAGTLSKTASTGTQAATAVSGMTAAPVADTLYKVVIVCSAVSGTLTYTLGGVTGTTITATTITDYITALNTNKISFSGGAAVTATITSVSIKPEAGVFVEDQIGGLFKLTQPRVNVTTSGTLTGTDTGVICAALSIKGQAIFHTDGTWVGTVVLQRCVDGVNWEDYKVYINRNADSEGFTEDGDGVQYRANVTSHASGDINADLTIDDSTQDGICIVLSTLGTTADPSPSAGVHVINDFASTVATTRWAEGAWSDYRGWPRTMTFYGERAICGGNTESPDTIWCSKVGDYYDFTEGTNDDDAFTLQIASEKRQEIQWIASKNGVAIGTTGGVWRLAGSINNPIMTPTNYDLVQQSAIECAGLQPIPAGDGLLFVNRALRHVYELTWSDSQWQYQAAPLTTLCEHLTAGGIVDWTLQKNPEPILWFVTDEDPYLFSLTLDKTQNVLAGARHPLGGDGIVESVCRIPGSSEDEVWLAARRTINSATVRYIERMRPWDFGDQEDAWFSDCALKYDDTAATSITGFDHLEGEALALLGDGVVHPAATVSSGAITLETAASVVIGGLASTYIIKPMRLDANPATRGLTKRISQVILSFYRSLGVKYGRTNDSLYEVFEQILANKYGLSDAAIFDSLRAVLIDRYGASAGATQFDIDWPRTNVFEAVPLFTGDVRVIFDGAFDENDDLIITGSDPLPCTLIAITAVLDGLGPQ